MSPQSDRKRADSAKTQAGAKRAPAQDTFHILPYSKVVEQRPLKLALELAYIAPGIGGVLISGERGTAKSTTVRAFARMVYSELPVTLPINATEDRVVGGWKIESMLNKKEPEPHPGLLEEANGKLLYIDEVNLLDDHIVNLILDVASTGVLDIQREGFSRNKQTRFTLVGTMNPEEGILRAQLLDRFGLMVDIKSETNPERRRDILRAVIEFDKTRTSEQGSQWLEEGRDADAALRRKLDAARTVAKTVELSDQALDRCIEIVKHFEAKGHRAEQTMALAAKAYVAHVIAVLGSGRTPLVKPEDINQVAELAVRHRRPKAPNGDLPPWTEKDSGFVLQSAAS